MTPERLAELRSKVHHGYNLLASEAREVFAHYGEPIEEQRKRCQLCQGGGCGTTRVFDTTIGQWIGVCWACDGTGYEVAK